MSSRGTFYLALGIITSWQPAGLAQGPLIQKPAAEPLKVYSSPHAVFDAYREACAKGDSRTAYYCLTPELRDHQVFEALFACIMHRDKPEVLAVQKKFGAELHVLHAEYGRRYKEKHGVDIAKVEAEYDAKVDKAVAEYRQKNKIGPDDHSVPSSVMEQVGPRPPRDEELFRKVLIDTVVDKVGFVVAVGQALPPSDEDPSQFGPLKGVQVKGDKATGQAAVTIYHITGGPVNINKKVSQRIDTTYYFRKTTAGWLIDAR